jgi:hypothetical protein
MVLLKTLLLLDKSNSVANVFTTSSGSSNVTVNQSAHGSILGDFVTISNVNTANVGGIANTSLEGEFEILSVPNSGAYIISTNGTASATVTDTANCDIEYQINIGPAIQTFAYGWNTGTWSAEAWNDARTTSEVTLDARLWSFK